MDLLKANDIAQRLAVSRAWVYEAARTGRIPSVRIGGEDGPLRFVPDDLEQWLADARAEWSPAAPRRPRAPGDAVDSRPSAHPRGRSRSGTKVVDQQTLL